MPTANDTNGNEPDDQDEFESHDDDFDPAEYNTLIQLERLESLEEDMKELGVASLDDIRRRIKELNAQLDEENNG